MNQRIKKLAAVASISAALLAATPVFSQVNQRALLAAPGALAFSTPGQSNHSSKKGASAMLVLLAKSGVIRQHGHAYQLTLSGVDPRTLWFTDRPVRMAGFDLTREFIARWHQVFSTSAPNAALVHLDSGLPPHGQPLAAELTNPVFQQGQLTFALQPLNNTPVHTGNIRYPVLFIDSFLGSIGGAFTHFGDSVASSGTGLGDAISSGVTTGADDTAGGIAIGIGAMTSNSSPTGGAAIAGAGERLIHGGPHKTVPKRTMQNVNITQLVNNADASMIAQQKALQAEANAIHTKAQSAFQGTLSEAESVSQLQQGASNSTGSSTTDLAVHEAANGAGNFSTTTQGGYVIPHDNLQV